MDITLQEFAQAVTTMPTVQTVYFKIKNKSLLRQSKEAELRVYNMLKQIALTPSPGAAPRQASLLA